MFFRLPASQQLIESFAARLYQAAVRDAAVECQLNRSACILLRISKRAEPVKRGSDLGGF